jgi:hypothetical protein
MIGNTAVDTSTMLVLAAIALAEGVARVPAGSVVFRRFLHGAWSVEGPTGPGNRLRLVHWWSPWTEALVAPRSHEAAPLNQARLISRMAATATVRRTARIIGAATLLLLVIGVPAGFGLAGAVGGMSALGSVLLGQIALGLLGWRGLGQLGVARRERLTALASILNPFAAPALAARLLAAATAGATPETVGRTLLSSQRWASWFRPRAYDAGVALQPDPDLAHGLEAADEAVAQVLAQRPPMASDALWCPRCAATYRAVATECAECSITLLKASQTVAPQRLRPEPSLS